MMQLFNELLITVPILADFFCLMRLLVIYKETGNFAAFNFYLPFRKICTILYV